MCKAINAIIMVAYVQLFPADWIQFYQLNLEVVGSFSQ